MQLSRRDMGQIVGIQRDLTASRSVLDLQMRTVSQLSGVLNSSVVLFMLDPEQRETTDGRMVAYGLDAKIQCPFPMLLKDNPLAIWARRMRQRWDAPVAVPPRFAGDLCNSAFYTEFMQPLGVDHTMAMGLVKEGRYLGLVGVFRPDREFDPEERALAGMLSYTIQSVLERTVLEEKLAETRHVLGLLDSAFEQQGLVVANAALEVRYKNLAAQQVLDKLRSPNERNNLPNSPLLPQVLRDRCIELAEHRAQAGGFELDVVRGGYSVQGRIEAALDHFGEPAFVIHLVSNSCALSHVQKMKKLGLTAREIDVVSAIAAGLPNKEVADRLCISFYTVQSHLKSIYEKLAVPNRASLINRINSVH